MRTLSAFNIAGESCPGVHAGRFAPRIARPATPDIAWRCSTAPAVSESNHVKRPPECHPRASRRLLAVGQQMLAKSCETNVTTHRPWSEEHRETKPVFNFRERLTRSLLVC